MNKFVQGLELSTRSSNCLSNNEIDSKEKLVSLTRKEMLSWPNFGPVSCNEVMDKIDSLRDRQINRRGRARITFWDNLILRGLVASHGSVFARAGSYQRRNALRLTYEFKESSTDEIIRLAYLYGKHGGSFVRAVMCGEFGH